MTPRLALGALAALALAACSDEDATTWLCDVGAQTGCGAGQACEYVGSIGSACFAPIAITGVVLDASAVATTAVPGARVVALDANRAPVSTVAVAATVSGAYEIGVRAPRDLSGRPISTRVTLRADAQGFQTFPGGIRPALPIDLSTAVPMGGGRFVVASPLTVVQLLPIAGGGGASISGTVARVPGIAPPLVVAAPVGAGTVSTGIADRDGSYAIFNLAPDASYVVTAYARGANHPGIATGPLVAGPNPGKNVGAPSPTAPGASLDGNLIFNNGASPPMQVTLVVEATYVTTLDRGESPPGLTVDVLPGAGGYRVSGVPDGRYVVLAAFGHDGKVRDVSGGGNTEAPRVTVSGGTLQGSPPGFKIKPAVELLTIGGAAVGVEPVVAVSSATPRFTWATGSAYSSAATYRVLVFDAFGKQVWSVDLPAANEAVDYAGAALQERMVYQLRILALSETPAELAADPLTVTQLSQTEDVLGVFTYRP